MVSLLSSIALCFSAFSFAWINWNVDLNSNSIKLTSGESVLYVDFYGYKESKTFPLFPDNTTSSDTSVQQNPIKTYITSTGDAQGTLGQYEVSTSFTFDDPVSLLDFYVGEHTFNYDLLPKVYLEFQYLKDVFDGYIKASIHDVSISDAYNVLEFYYVTDRNDGNYEHILRKDQTDYKFTKADSISSSIDLFGNPNDDPPTYGYTQLKVPKYNNHKDAGKLLYSKATLIMIKFNSENFKNYLANNISAASASLKISLNFTITFDYSNDPYYTKIPNNTQTSGNTSA